MSADAPTPLDEEIAAGLTAQGDALLAAVTGAEDPLMALALAWRTWAAGNPDLYRLISARDLEHQSDAIAAAERHAGAAICTLTGDDLVAARAFWAFVHGMVTLELNQRFPPGSELDEQWVAGIDALRALIPAA
jgi:hypothetical protein